jgi:hypothetical protein
MTYVAPTITELGSVHALTLEPSKGSGGTDGRSQIPSDPKPGGGMS